MKPDAPPSMASGASGFIAQPVIIFTTANVGGKISTLIQRQTVTAESSCRVYPPADAAQPAAPHLSVV